MRLGQRTRLVDAAKRIQATGGSVFYASQSPSVVDVPVAIPNAYYTVSVPYSETLEDGSVVQKMRTETAGRNAGFSVLSQQVRPNNLAQPEFQLTSFLAGTHQDVSVVAVSLPADNVGKDVIDTLNKFADLESVLLLVNERYFSVELSTRSTAEIRKDELDELGKGLRNAIEMIRIHLPHVELKKRGILRDSK